MSRLVHIAHIGTLGTTVERPHELISHIAGRRSSSLGDIDIDSVWRCLVRLVFLVVPCFWSYLSMSHNND